MVRACMEGVALSLERVSVGWEVKAIPNVIGKIPVILFEQELEGQQLEPLLNLYHLRDVHIVR